MPVLIIGGLTAAVGLVGGWIVGGEARSASEQLGAAVWWAAIGAGGYMLARHFKVVR